MQYLIILCTIAVCFRKNYDVKIVFGMPQYSLTLLEKTLGQILHQTIAKPATEFKPIARKITLLPDNGIS